MYLLFKRAEKFRRSAYSDHFIPYVKCVRFETSYHTYLKWIYGQWNVYDMLSAKNLGRYFAEKSSTFQLKKSHVHGDLSSFQNWHSQIGISCLQVRTKYYECS